jgi:hypothetical protein
VSAGALNWVAALAGPIRDGVPETEGWLVGAARPLLWAAANRAHPTDHRVRMAGRRWAAEAGITYTHLKRLLPQLVELKVLEKAEAGRGRRPAVYRFTLRDPAGLPVRLHNDAPEPAPLRSIREVDWRSEMTRDHVVPASGHPRSPLPQQDGDASGHLESPLEEASGHLRSPQTAEGGRG